MTDELDMIIENAADESFEFSWTTDQDEKRRCFVFSHLSDHFDWKNQTGENIEKMETVSQWLKTGILKKSPVVRLKEV